MDEQDYIVKVGENIKTIRNKKGMSQAELAAKCDMEFTNLSRIEAGRTNPTLKTLVKIANAMSVNILELLKP